MASGLPRPPYAPGLKPALDQIKAAGFNTKPKKEDIGIIRQFTDNSTNINNVLAGRAIQHEEQTIPSSDGSNAELTISIFRPSSSSSTTTPTTTHPCIYYTHGGGFISGTRHLGVSSILDWVESLPAICISIEYRLPPEHPDPTPLEDCYDGLLWISSHASELGINPDCLLLAGISAGGGLAAGLALLARDRKGPKIRAQILVCPMLDDRDATVSAHQYSDEGFWSRECNQLGWSCLLGERAGGQDGGGEYLRRAGEGGGFVRVAGGVFGLWECRGF